MRNRIFSWWIITRIILSPCCCMFAFYSLRGRHKVVIILSQAAPANETTSLTWAALISQTKYLAHTHLFNDWSWSVCKGAVMSPLCCHLIITASEDSKSITQLDSLDSVLGSLLKLTKSSRSLMLPRRSFWLHDRMQSERAKSWRNFIKLLCKCNFWHTSDLEKSLQTQKSIYTYTEFVGWICVWIFHNTLYIESQS